MEFRHHGIQGQKWGVRRFQNKDGSLTAAGKKRRREALFVSGSSKTTDPQSPYYRPLPTKVSDVLDKTMRQKTKIIVGDAPGIDRQVQDYINSKGYKKVEVYGPGKQVRYSANKSWKTKPIDAPEFEEGSKEWLAKKDIAMTNASTKGLAVTLDEGSEDGASYTTPLGRTVYGGTVDLVSGVLTVDRAIVTISGTETWNVATESYIKVDACDAFTIKNDMKGTAPSTSFGMSNMLKSASVSIWSSTGHANEFVFNTNQIHINIANDLLGIADYTQETKSSVSTKIKAWLAQQYSNGKPLTIAYPLATPQVYQLPPTEMRTLYGENHIWADAGPVNVHYHADTKLYIDGVVADLKTYVNSKLS